ncbi:MAG: ribonuclease HI [Elusimicrobia bacterium GWC2_51_8]|nr:MAG: ribonuclease HI [Elusimicrobia bacterium GWA2_51_34]OGR58138.1 MAG: ribonuclease HI [Elusimicrobia bacterium GWC2_51_8]OGR84418.1 MAG: ribonuclease HI [Elusimicrobia bacterium GWF2_52_66]HAF95109.1 ribonuclease HI [Elusimicrobiota bacterium]HCE98628.1 ribonuclease HI [Elusimicrobiota bacterium]
MANTIFIYCDGACSGNPGPGGWGTVIILPENRVRELGGGGRPTTNNRMEMRGAIAALSAVQDRPEPVRLYTDSSLLINGITGWIHAWKRKGWKTAEGKPVVNRDLWERLDRLVLARKGRLTWGHVKGHAGHEINERCDEIAVAFSRGNKPCLYEGPAVGCGYSLLEPGTEHLREPAPRPAKPFSRPKARGGFYLSLVAGRVERHATWPQCQERVHGVSKARFKKVTSAEEEQAVLKLWGAA